VPPSAKDLVNNNANAVADHAQHDSTAQGVQVADDIESGDKEQETTGHRSSKSFRRVKSFVAENKIIEKSEIMVLLYCRLWT